MAYVTQYEADMQGDARNRQNQAAIGGAIANVASMFKEDRGRALATRKAQEAQDLAFAKEGIDQESIDAFNKGDKSGIAKFYSDLNQVKRDQEKRDKLIAGAKGDQALYEADQLKKPLKERDEYIKSIDSAKTRAEISSGVMADRMDAQEQNRIAAEQRKLDNERKKGLQDAAIPDFDVADTGIVPSSKDAEEVKKLNASNKSFQQIGTSVKERLGTVDARNPSYYLSNDWKMLNQDLTKMKLQAKNLEDLGVLNGPDLSLVNETLGSINPTSLALLGPEKAQQRIGAALDNSQKVLMNAASSRGYKPKTPKQEQNLSSERQELELLRQMKNKQMASR